MGCLYKHDEPTPKNNFELKARGGSKARLMAFAVLDGRLLKGLIFPVKLVSCALPKPAVLPLYSSLYLQLRPLFNVPSSHLLHSV